MIGAIIGDIVGSRFESSPKHPNPPVENKTFELFGEKCRFTDDTVLTCATADAILHRHSMLNIDKPPFGRYYKKWGKEFPDRGYGGGFKKWMALKGLQVSNSYANGAMMRCSPIGMFYSKNALTYALRKAKESILHTHNSPESIRGVQSIVSAIHMAKNGFEKGVIKDYVEEQFGHMLNLTVEDARKLPKTSIRCNLSAPQALVAFMESTDYESAIRNAVYIGGDTDTNAAIAGAIAEAYYGTDKIPLEWKLKVVREYLPIKMSSLMMKFYHSMGSKFENYL